ncbi:ethanolamine ammonia-lyase subunit EutC [Paracoccus amoyensis]|uniref:ethanolamine ammonia-lyase subunit EutC n=1 Tax=Paracoccus amoyensis TaxID=2760093 RepID=UPI001FEB11FE|nr:ethanolamine ammonia-lyase subunit EutC [Paracoccus amoyensis]
MRRFTDARIGLGRVGISLPTRELLNFQIAHAQARDAVHLPLETGKLTEELAAFQELGHAIILHSRAADRTAYLRYPPQGEVLDEASVQRLETAAQESPDIALVIADGLSSFALQNNIVAFLQKFLPVLKGVTVSPPIIVEQARVAIGDHVGQLLRARATLVMIGERPGLSSPDSLGHYFTWAPETGLINARRNCISNVRQAGLDYGRAARRAAYLYFKAAKIGRYGVALKDRSADDAVLGAATGSRSFLATPP